MGTDYREKSHFQAPPDMTPQHREMLIKMRDLVQGRTNVYIRAKTASGRTMTDESGREVEVAHIPLKHLPLHDAAKLYRLLTDNEHQPQLLTSEKFGGLVIQVSDQVGNDLQDTREPIRGVGSSAGISFVIQMGNRALPPEYESPRKARHAGEEDETHEEFRQRREAYINAHMERTFAEFRALIPEDHKHQAHVVELNTPDAVHKPGMEREASLVTASARRALVDSCTRCMEQYMHGTGKRAWGKYQLSAKVALGGLGQGMPESRDVHEQAQHESQQETIAQRRKWVAQAVQDTMHDKLGIMPDISLQGDTLSVTLASGWTQRSLDTLDEKITALRQELGKTHIINGVQDKPYDATQLASYIKSHWKELGQELQVPVRSWRSEQAQQAQAQTVLGR